jgi:hypothetical protein
VAPRDGQAPFQKKRSSRGGLLLAVERNPFHRDVGLYAAQAFMDLREHREEFERLQLREAAF